LRRWFDRRFDRRVGVIGELRRRHLGLALLVVLPLVGATVFALGLDGHAALDAVRRHHLSLLGFVDATPVLAALAFMALYGAAVAASVPGVGVLTVIGGYLFGWWQATTWVLIATLIAASAVFLFARSTLGGPLRRRAGPAVQRFAEAFRAHAWSYLFLLYLVPVFPFAMVIGIPAACGVRLRTFVTSALLGLLPGTLLLAHLGSGLGAVLQDGLPLDPAAFLTTQIIVSLAGLAGLALLPLVYRAVQRRRRGA
jgi:uncharacterized membrane protein YdjX (TVP38/TMEM64 family)